MHLVVVLTAMHAYSLPHWCEVSLLVDILRVVLLAGDLCGVVHRHHTLESYGIHHAARSVHEYDGVLQLLHIPIRTSSMLGVSRHDVLLTHTALRSKSTSSTQLL